MFTPIHTPRVLVVVFNPTIDGKAIIDRVTDEKRNPYTMTEMFVDEVAKASNGILQYRLENSIEISDFPQFVGRKYDEKTFKEVLKDPSKAWKDGNDWAMLDYAKMYKTWKMKAYDEVWMWGAGYFGFYESRMVGSRSYFVNAPALEIKNVPPRIFMGFNYERTWDYMLHALGHRIESILPNVDYYRFKEWMKIVGTIHTKSGEVGEYAYGTQGHEEYMKEWHSRLFPEWWKYIAYPRLAHAVK